MGTSISPQATFLKGMSVRSVRKAKKTAMERARVVLAAAKSAVFANMV